MSTSEANIAAKDESQRSDVSANAANDRSGSTARQQTQLTSAKSEASSSRSKRSSLGQPPASAVLPGSQNGGGGSGGGGASKSPLVPLPPINPFKMPKNQDIFALRDKELEKKKQERLRQRGLKVHEKVYQAPKMNFRQVSKMIDQEDDSLAGDDSANLLKVREDPEFVISVTKDRQIEKETLAEYITKKREMFLLEYSLGVKREEMRKLEEIGAAEEKKLELAEQYLEEDAAMFDEFLTENNKNSTDAMKTAEAESRDRMAKVTEIKRLATQMSQIKSDISKCEEQLKDYKKYKTFLERLVPDEVREEREKRRQARTDKQKSQMQSEPRVAATPVGSKALVPATNRTGTEISQTMNSDADGILHDISDDESDNELYFTDPQQLLDVFTELEESNLNLIQNCQETEESLEELKQVISATEKKMNKDTSTLVEQIEKLNKAIEIEKDKYEELELKAKFFSFGDIKSEDQDAFLEQLDKKVEQVYKTCVSDSEAKMSTLDMLTAIENYVVELFENIDQLPPEKVELAQKEKEKERRAKIRKEKLELKKVQQDERFKKALERAAAAPKKQLGRKAITRSEPPQLKKEDDALNDARSREEEEMLYFFT